MTVKQVLQNAERWEGLAVRFLKDLLENILFPEGDYMPRAQELLETAPTVEAMALVNSWARSDQLTLAAGDLELAMIAAFKATAAAAEAQGALDIATKQLIAQGYADGTIAGKNETERKNAEVLALANSDLIEAFRAETVKRDVAKHQAGLDLDIAKIRFKVAELLVKHEAAMANVTQTEGALQELMF